jgi:adenylate cyclase
MLYQLCREREETLRHADEAVTLCSEQGLPFWLSMVTILRGWALTELGDQEVGITQLQTGLAAWQAAGSEILQPYWLALLAEAYGKTGKFAEGLKLLDESLARINKTEERFYRAEVYRIKGQVLLWAYAPEQESSTRKAEECFLKAIDIACQQQAKSLELRAVMSLVRLRQQQASAYGSRNTTHASRAALAEAHIMLSDLYRWFTEGFDTKDLQEAKALLASLESGV